MILNIRSQIYEKNKFLNSNLEENWFLRSWVIAICNSRNCLRVLRRDFEYQICIFSKTKRATCARKMCQHFFVQKPKLCRIHKHTHFWQFFLCPTILFLTIFINFKTAQFEFLHCKKCCRAKLTYWKIDNPQF